MKNDEKSWIIQDFQDFPMILGNLGVETGHPPEMCAGPVLSVFRGRQCPPAARSRGVLRVLV